MISPSLAEKVLKATLRNGGELAEVFVERRSGTRLLLEESRIEEVASAAEQGIGIRLVRDRREVYGYSNDFSPEKLLEIAAFLAQSARNGPPKSRKFSFKISKAPARGKIKIPPAKVPPEKKAEFLWRADRRARSFPHVRQVSVGLRDSLQEVLVANSEGTWAEDQRTQIFFYTQAVAERSSLVQTAYEPLGGTAGYEILGGEACERVAEAAATRARMLLSAAKPKGGPMTVVLSSRAGGTMVHEAVGHGLEADLAQEGQSVYEGKVGERVASSLLTIADDATLKGKRGSYRFDDEGTPSQKTVLIEKGILKGYLQSRLTALKGSARATGNGRRESYECLPVVRMTNTMILPGKDDPDAIVRSVERGLFVTQMGGGQVNTVNGDFVFEVSEGYLIEKGKIGPPVRGATLVGNGPRVLEEIDRVGNDLGFGIGTCGKDGQDVPVADAQPTLRIPELVVGSQESSK